MDGGLYTIFDDEAVMRQFKSDVSELAEAGFRGRLEEEGPAVASGKFRGSSLELSRRYPCGRRHQPDDSPTTDILQDAADRRCEVGQTLLGLPDLDKYLGQTDTETLMNDRRLRLHAIPDRRD